MAGLSFFGVFASLYGSVTRARLERTARRAAAGAA
jgi:hypothetical protein